MAFQGAASEPDAVTEVNAHYRASEGVTTGNLCEAVQRGDVPAVRDMLRRRSEIVNLELPDHGEQRVCCWSSIL